MGWEEAETPPANGGGAEEDREPAGSRRRFKPRDAGAEGKASAEDEAPPPKNASKSIEKP